MNAMSGPTFVYLAIFAALLVAVLWRSPRGSLGMIAIAGVIGAAWLVALRAEDVRTLNNARPVRIAALSVFALLVALGLNGLVRDFRDILL